MPLPFRGLPFYILCTHGASLSLSRRRHQFLHPYNISQGVPAPMGGILTMHQPHHPKDDWDCGIYPYYWLSLSALKGDGAVMPAHAGCISMAWLSGFMIASAQFGIQQRMLVVLQPCGCAFIFSLPSFLSGIKKAAACARLPLRRVSRLLCFLPAGISLFQGMLSPPYKI